MRIRSNIKFSKKRPSGTNKPAAGKNGTSKRPWIDFLVGYLVEILAGLTIIALTSYFSWDRFINNPYISIHLEGKVVDSETGQGIPNIPVVVVNAAKEVKTDPQGDYRIEFKIRKLDDIILINAGSPPLDVAKNKLDNPHLDGYSLKLNLALDSRTVRSVNTHDNELSFAK